MGIFDIFKKKPQAEPKPLFYDIVCPFCFEKFTPEAVVFRAAHHREDDENYALGEDNELNRYRERFGLDTVDDIEAIIHPTDIPEEHRIYSDHVLIGLNDRYGVLTRRRLCPKCHNELPVTSGKVPSNIISIVGASQVGKSVYMTSLIHTLQNTTADNFDAACMPLNAEISRKFRTMYEEPLFERGDLLASTQKEKMQEPFIFQFVFKDESKPPLTLVFFDVAGEGMVDQDYLGLHGQHIKNSAGILFMVDPLQIRSIREKIKIKFGDTEGGWVSQYDEPRDVVLTMFGDFIAYEDKGKTDIPTAVVLTKSDMLHSLKDEEGEYIKSNSNIFNNMVHRKTLNLTEFENIDGEIRHFIEKVDRPFKGTMDVYFANTAYFAVSALGSNPVDQKLQGVASPIRVDEPFIWLLYQLMYIEGSEE
ncbi:TRAFAC clade GTPase domain-containing protein [Paenibacillus macquariensis]|uniref:Double-GTPase 2 domain-containing protein n=1 Tax=Paenibacillus macquariensis TaxID=948756 RepID=A0ABY1KB26_9BACL|nr:hypothetical protein [Paenibacillus macquariensis]MEC0089539.1 hypothetical protein [Paenibacillus macquariensis]OAB25791.1 hypothetical protein PMSM_27870 [Paenibacillus macquariensis subsp. macquariensis]SIR53435.1 hypothetical protein SAMN05421578_11792 [Paenibacillus macquariensis]